MAIIDAFTQTFFRVYHSDKIERDYEIAIEFYFPSIISKPKVTLDELADIHHLTRERINQVIERFETALRNAISKNFGAEQVAYLRDELYEAHKVIVDHGCFLSLECLSQTLNLARSLSGVIRLGGLYGIDEVVHIISVNDKGFIVPTNISKDILENAIKSARKNANYYGSMYPYDQMPLIEEWSFVPNQYLCRFAKELISIEEDFISLGDGEYFRFSKLSRDRILSRLVQIFSIYEEVPVESLVASVYRSIEKRILVSKDNHVSILKECSEVFDEYCLVMGYCQKVGNNLKAAPQLIKYIKENPPSGKMYEIECRLVDELRQNKAPMHTAAFVDVMKSLNADVSHIMEHAVLIYRKGYRKNSTYHSLDDLYQLSEGNYIQVQPADRNRIEVNRIYRNIRLAMRIKRLCEYKCQICGARIQIGEDEYYSEVHHIMPLGEPHNGPDQLDNMLCVCPNHHVMLDYGVIQLKLAEIKFIEVNPVSENFIKYYNENIFQHEG